MNDNLFLEAGTIRSSCRHVLTIYSQPFQRRMKQPIHTSHPGLRFSHILNQFHDYLHFYQHFGFEGIPNVAINKEAPPPPPSLEELKQIAQQCQACQLHQERNSVVFGAGSPHARLMFIGDAPGEEEDREGIPFSGEAGELLTRIIEAIKLRREDVYLCNLVKCRPATNRIPERAEIDQCSDYLRRQIELIQPKIICALGTLAAQSLLETHETIEQLRGTFHHYNGILMMPTYHPAHLLEHPEDKRQVWADMQKIQKAYAEFDENS